LYKYIQAKDILRYGKLKCYYLKNPNKYEPKLASLYTVKKENGRNNCNRTIVIILNYTCPVKRGVSAASFEATGLGERTGHDYNIFKKKEVR
jgi:hypothetical protein